MKEKNYFTKVVIKQSGALFFFFRVRKELIAQRQDETDVFREQFILYGVCCNHYVIHPNCGFLATKLFIPNWLTICRRLLTEHLSNTILTYFRKAIPIQRYEDVIGKDMKM